MNQNFKNFFSFNKQERKGILVLTTLLICVILADIYYPFGSRDKKPDFSEFKKQVAQFEKLVKDLETSKEKTDNDFDYTDVDKTIARKQLKPFPFDPNTLSEKGWLKMGVPEKTVKTIINYRLKGGKFREKEDLQRIYGLTESEYNILKPFIRIEQTSAKEDKKFYAKQIDPVDFDPNLSTEEELLAMNIREKLVNTIINYRDKGGRFYKKEDFRKIYGMSDKEYAALKPYIKLSAPVDSLSDTLNRAFYKKDLLMIDLNSSDTLDLQQLRGIGPKFAQKIVKYRDLLGGYHSKEQLLEVYGMDSSRYQGFEKNVFVTTDSIRRIDINKASLKEFIKHPYIEYYLARSLIMYRSENGGFTSLEEMVNAHLIYQELFEKLKPYFIIKNDNFEG